MSDLDLMVTRVKGVGMTRAYKVGQVDPANPPASAYAVLGLDTGTTVTRRTGGVTSVEVRRLTVQMFGTSDDAVRDMARYADLAFKEVELTELTDDPFSIRELTNGPTRDPDGGGVLSILHVYKF